MGQLLRLLPLLLLAGGLLWATPKMKVLYHKTVTSVQTFFIGMELGRIADKVRQEGSSYGCDLEDPDQLADFIHDFFVVEAGTRDSAVDTWGMPFALECLGDDQFVVFSLGPNRTPNECGVTDGDWNRVPREGGSALPSPVAWRP